MGFPKEAYYHTQTRMSLDEFILGNISPITSTSFIMQVGNESMQEEGIFPGDFLIVERGSIPKPGDLVIASSQGEFVLHYFSLWKSSRPFPTDYRLEAVVKAVIRKY